MKTIQKIVSLIPFVSWLALPKAVLAAEEGLSLGTFGGIGGYLPEVNPKEGGLGTTGNVFATFFSNILGFLTLLAGIFFLIYFLIGALSWLTSSGKREQVEKAKQSMTNAAIGLIIVVAAYGIAFIVGTVLGLDILNIGAAIEKIGAGAPGE